MDLSPSYTFSSLESQIPCFQTSEAKEQLVQYNLDKSLNVYKFRFAGNFSATSSGDYDQLIRDFFCSEATLSAIQAEGSPSLPLEYTAIPLGVSVMNMEFFDKLVEAGIVSESGNIRGCYDETYDGITVSDQLRELLLNEDSENASVFSESDKNEFIFQLMRIFAVGGSLCQPDNNFNRYTNITKAFYKELVTIYRDSKTDNVTISGRVFKVTRVNGVEIFPSNSKSPHNTLLLMVDPLKKVVTVVKYTFLSFW